MFRVLILIIEMAPKSIKLILHVLCSVLTYLSICTNMSVSNMVIHELNVTAWNVRGMSTSYAYLSELLKRNDIVLLNEHWLAGPELYKLGLVHPSFHATAKAGQSFNNHSLHAWGGVAVLWNKQIDCFVKVIQVNNTNRMCVIRIKQRDMNDLNIICVYLPHTGCDLDEFINELVVLEELVITFSQCGEILILGDMNCHFGEEIGTRGWGKTTKQAKLLLEMTKRHALTIVDMYDVCKGPRYTFLSPKGKSYIDHFILSDTLVTSTTECSVVEDTIMNTSDHLPIRIKIKLNTLIQRNVLKPSANIGVAWHKMSPSDIECCYTKRVESEIQKTCDSLGITNLTDMVVSNNEDVNSLTNMLVTIITRCTDNLPKKGFNRAVKPYWTKDLSLLSKRNKQICSIWKMAGCPRDVHNIIWQEYKYVKKLFRKKQRAAIKKYEREQMKAFVESKELDTKYYWYLVNLSRKIQQKRILPVKLDSGEIITDSAHIQALWYDYFKNMYTESDSSCFDREWFDFVNDQISHDIEMSYGIPSTLLSREFGSIEIEKCILDMKFKKAPGIDGITAEHVKYGGKKLQDIILYLMNCMLRLEVMPDELKKGLLVPIPKARKDATIRDNNRGITLLCMFYKLYQSLLKNRVESKFLQTLENVQGAGRKQLSCLQTSLLVRETIAYNIENNKDVHICMLDARKAFDSVWVNGLMFKLFRANIDPKLFRIVCNMYENFKCAVRIHDTISAWFKLEVGVQQGAPLSLWLYELYINELLTLLKNTECGAKFFDINITCPTYADDIALLATSPGKLQALIDVAHSYCKKWRYTFNAQKSEVICFSKNQKRCKNEVFWLGNEQLKIAEKSKHLGTVLSMHKKHELEGIRESIYRCKQTLSAVYGIGSNRVPISTLSLSQLYWTLCTPILTYGCEVMPLGDAARQLLDGAHWSFARDIQRLPGGTPNPCVLPQIGWMRLSGVIDMLKLNFLWRILMLPMSSLYKVVAVKRILYSKSIDMHTSLSPIIATLSIAKKYGVFDILLNCLVNVNVLSCGEFKVFVKQKIKQYEWKQHIVSFCMYKHIDMFTSIFQCMKMWPWYVHCSRYPEFGKSVTLLTSLVVGYD